MAVFVIEWKLLSVWKVSLPLTAVLLLPFPDSLMKQAGPSDVTVATVYQQYDTMFKESDDKVYCLAQFRFGGEDR